MLYSFGTHHMGLYAVHDLISLVQGDATQPLRDGLCSLQEAANIAVKKGDSFIYLGSRGGQGTRSG